MLALPGADTCQLGGGLNPEAMVRFAARFEYAVHRRGRMLARRSRLLFLDAQFGRPPWPTMSRPKSLRDEETGRGPATTG